MGIEIIAEYQGVPEFSGAQIAYPKPANMKKGDLLIAVCSWGYGTSSFSSAQNLDLMNFDGNTASLIREITEDEDPLVTRYTANSSGNYNANGTMLHIRGAKRVANGKAMATVVTQLGSSVKDTVIIYMQRDSVANPTFTNGKLKYKKDKIAIQSFLANEVRGTLTSGKDYLYVDLYSSNTIAKIFGPASSLGNKSNIFNFDYSATDADNESITSKVTLNGTTIDTATSATGNIATRTVTIPQSVWDVLTINTAYTITITVTDAKGETATSTHTFTKVNAAPTAQLVEPKGDAVNVPIVDKTQPILVWNFKDTDIGDVQSAYQVVIEDINGLIVHDSTKKIGTASYYQVPINLEWTKTYKWKVTVWDKYDVPSNASEYGFFKPNRAPNLTGITPGSTDKLLPSKVGSTPVYTWTFEDLDVEAQAGYQLQIFKTADDSIVYNTNRVSKNVQTHTITENVLLPGVEYYAILTVWDPNNLSATSGKLYIATNATPSAPTLTRPIDNFRTPIAPTLAAVIGTDLENDKQHFKIQLSQDKDFASGVVEFSSLTSRTGWKVDGFDIPIEGVDNSAAGKSVELTLQTNLEKNKTYYWRMAAIDTNTQAVGKYSTARKIRVGNRIEYDTLKRQIPTSETAARRILVALDYMLAKDGTKPSEIKVFVSNNAMDVLPTWEDATTEFLRQDYYTFTNATKTADTFGVGVKVVIEANDSMEPISINAAGITFD